MSGGPLPCDKQTVDHKKYCLKSCIPEREWSRQKPSLTSDNIIDYMVIYYNLLPGIYMVIYYIIFSLVSSLDFGKVIPPRHCFFVFFPMYTRPLTLLK